MRLPVQPLSPPCKLPCDRVCCCCSRRRQGSLQRLTQRPARSPWTCEACRRRSDDWPARRCSALARRLRPLRHTQSASRSRAVRFEPSRPSTRCDALCCCVRAPQRELRQRRLRCDRCFTVARVQSRWPTSCTSRTRTWRSRRCTMSACSVPSALRTLQRRCAATKPSSSQTRRRRPPLWTDPRPRRCR